MTNKSRVVLQDAKHAIGKHSKTLQSEAFRVSWFTVVALLRAVGHVLQKVDAESSPAMRRAIREKWEQLHASKPEPKIFWGFIECERNRFLKNYEHGIDRSLTVPALIEGHWITVDGGNSRGGEFAPGAEYDSQIADGPYAGRYERDVAWEAYDWWVSYLNEIDALAETYSTSNSSLSGRVASARRST